MRKDLEKLKELKQKYEEFTGLEFETGDRCAKVLKKSDTVWAAIKECEKTIVAKQKELEKIDKEIDKENEKAGGGGGGSGGGGGGGGGGGKKKGKDDGKKAKLEKELKEAEEAMAKAILQYKEVTGVDYDLYTHPLYTHPLYTHPLCTHPLYR
jgi:DNA repair exonuclease SbcCD ATPase subunit